jgi:hypothetical protein
MSIERDVKACSSHAKKNARATPRPPTGRRSIRTVDPRHGRKPGMRSSIPLSLYPDYTVGPGIKPGLLTLSPMLRRQALAG